MKFETFRIASRGATSSALADYFMESRPGQYDPIIARELCAVSAWSYSEPDTFARMMSRRGFPESECVSVSFANDALFVDNTVLFMQTTDRRLAILAFRGTQPLNAINWLANFSVRVEPFRQGGLVHGGFHHAILALSSPVGNLLDAISQGESIRDAMVADQKSTILRSHRDQVEEILLRYRAIKAVKEQPEGKLEKVLQGELEKALQGEPDTAGLERPPQRLYFTGHSLGGALAVLAAARMHRGGTQYFELAHKLAGIYTFGQPMVGNSTFAEICQRDFGDKLFRHVYEHDVVPAMPPRTAGSFAHTGEEYISTDHGWVKRTPAGAFQATSVLTSTIIATSAWLLEQLPIFAWLKLPYSLADHSPLNYLHVSQTSTPGAEIEGE
jgi:hypothetical protein